MNLARLVHNAKMGDGEVVELLKIHKRISSQTDRLNEEKSSLEAEISSRRAELNNIARTYQQFCDRNLELKKREDELQYSINELEAKESELQRTISGLKQQLSEL